MIVSFEYVIKFTRQLETIMYAMSFLDQDANDQAVYDNQLQPALQILQEWEEKARLVTSGLAMTTVEVVLDSVL